MPIKFITTRRLIMAELEMRLDSMREGCPYLVTVRRFYQPRSTGWKSQNHHIHGHATQIGAFVGDTKSEIIRIAQNDALTKGYPTTLNHLGEIIPAGEQNLDSRGAAILIDQLHEMAGFIPDLRLIESSAEKTEDHV